MNDVIRQGATWYRELTLTEAADKALPYSTANSQPVDLTGKTPRASMMDLDGVPVASLSCAVLGEATAGHVALVLSAANATGLTRGNRFIDVDLDGQADLGSGAVDVSDPAARINIVVIPGQKKP
jgi:hypothetical protein